MRCASCRSADDLVDEQAVHAVVPGDLGVERRREQRALPDRDDPTGGRPVPTRASTSTPGPASSTQGARMSTAWNGSDMPAKSTSVSQESTWRPKALRRTVTSSPPTVSWPGGAALDPVGQQDHARAGAERRQPGADGACAAAPAGRTRPPACASWWTRRRARPGRRRSPARRGGGPASAGCRATRARRRARGHHPAATSTPTTGRLTGGAQARWPSAGATTR